jgi:glycosyltransferase involved in cell wall biosynthesis
VELYGADRILAECLVCLSDWNVTLLVPKDGPLIPYLMDRCPSLNIIIDPTLPIIARKLFSIRGTFGFLSNFVRFGFRLKKINQVAPIRLLYVSTLATFAVSALAWLIRIPCIVHVHEIIEMPIIVFEFTASVIARCATRVICVSDAVRQNLLRNSTAEAQSDKFVTVHNGIREPFVTCALRENFQERKRMKFSLFGRIKPDKGQWLLIDALTHLSQEQRSRIKVDIVGGVVSGEEHLIGELRDKIENSGLCDVVSILPFTDDISTLLQTSDVCLVPSLMKDPFPTVVLEAMAAAKPVIATSTGGIPEMLTHRENGLLFSPESPEEFASCVSLLLDRPDMVRTMGAISREKYKEQFTIEEFTRRFRVAALGGDDGAADSAIQ